jgi:hypothetical protein
VPGKSGSFFYSALSFFGLDTTICPSAILV